MIKDLGEMRESSRQMLRIVFQTGDSGFKALRQECLNVQETAGRPVGLGKNERGGEW